MITLDPSEYFKPLKDPCRPLKEPCRPLKEPCIPIIHPCRPIDAFNEDKLYLFGDIDEYFDDLDIDALSELFDDFEIEQDMSISRTTKSGSYEIMTIESYLRKYWNIDGTRKTQAEVDKFFLESTFDISKYTQVASADELSWKDFFTLGRTETTAQKIARKISEEIKIKKVPETWNDTTIFKHLMNRWAYGKGTPLELSQSAMKRIIKRGNNPSYLQDLKFNLDKKCSHRKELKIAKESKSDFGGYQEAWYLGGHSVKIEMRKNCSTNKITGTFTVTDTFDFDEDGGWKIKNISSRIVGVGLTAGTALFKNSKFPINGTLQIKEKMIKKP